NYAAKESDALWLLFLDNTVEIVDREWLTIMAEHIQRPQVGAVGARLLNSDDTVEHAGIVVGVNGISRPTFRGFPAEHPGTNRQLQVTRNCSAISSACMLTRREVFHLAGGFDENLSGAFADVDVCLKIRRADYLIVCTPFAKLHSRTRRFLARTPLANSAVMLSEAKHLWHLRRRPQRIRDSSLRSE